ncbi:MAG TPA: metal-dependent transcriptional regulator [Candidatus Thermoplasmatota archaeon]|nr:metal-dependent transcriptional regulator [Candidatus Thermoplasmatota archaeon]
MPAWTPAAEQESIDEYLETLCRMGDGHELVKTGDLAAAIETSPAAVSEMLGKLAERGYVEHAPYKGVRLTDKGRERGRFILRNHRLLEMWLLSELKLEPRRAHETACAMEHSVVPEFDRWLCERLGHPRRSAKGKEIPRGPCCPRA